MSMKNSNDTIGESNPRPSGFWRSASNNNLDILKVNLNLKEFSLLFGIERFAQIFLSLYNNIKNVINEFFFPFLLLNGALMMSLDAVQPVIA